MKKLSIIVSMYNVSRYIEDLIDSLGKSITKGATSKIVEVILVNDGSIDSTLEIVYKKISEYPAINWAVINKENGGLGSARNAGLQASTGEWIWQIDGDDMISIDAISILIKNMSNKLQMIYFKFYRDKKFVNTEWQPRRNKKWLYSRGNTPWSHVYRKKMWSNEQYFPRNNADLGSFVPISKINFDDILFIKDRLYYWRDVKNSMSNSKTNIENEIKGYIEFRKCVETLRSLLPSKNFRIFMKKTPNKVDLEFILNCKINRINSMKYTENVSSLNWIIRYFPRFLIKIIFWWMV